MNVSRRRRWLLAIVTIVVVAGVVVFVVLREEGRDDAPRLVILRQEEVNGEKRVVFRLDAPKHARAMLMTMATVDGATGEERRPRDTTGDILLDIAGVFTAQGAEFDLIPWLEAEAGQSRAFRILSPADRVWRLRCQAAVNHAGIIGVRTRVRSCWQRRSLAPLRWKVALTPYFIESDPITNALPKTADAPAK